MIIVYNPVGYDDDDDDENDEYDIHDDGGDIYDEDDLVKASICPIPLKLCLGKTMPGFNVITTTMMLMTVRRMIMKMITMMLTIVIL